MVEKVGVFYQREITHLIKTTMADQDEKQDALGDLETAREDGAAAKEEEADAQERLADVAREEAAEAERQADAAHDAAVDDAQ